MKLRNGFVSNSSSSSYIVAVTVGCTDGDAAQDIAEKVFGDDFEEVKDYLSRLCFASSLTLLKEEEKGLVYFSKIGLKVSYEAKKEDSSEINKRIEILKKEIERSSKMLNNPAFVKKAPEALVNKEREKLKANEEELAKYLK